MSRDCCTLGYGNREHFCATCDVRFCLSCLACHQAIPALRETHPIKEYLEYKRVVGAQVYRIFVDTTSIVKEEFTKMPFQILVWPTEEANDNNRDARLATRPDQSQAGSSQTSKVASVSLIANQKDAAQNQKQAKEAMERPVETITTRSGRTVKATFKSE